MKKGFARPLLLLIIVLIIALPLSYQFLKDKLSFLKTDDVKGVSSVNTKPGFSLNVVSNGSWELSQYLCVTKEECTQDLTSGKKAETINGGPSSSQKITVPFSPSWSEYKYIKYFVKPAWGSAQRNFTVSSLGNITGSEKRNFLQTEAVISPLNEITEKFLESATFSDK